MQASTQLWLNTINTRQTELRQAVSDVLIQIVGDNADRKEEYIQLARQKAYEVRNLLAAKDVPPWLQSVINIFGASRPNYPISQMLRELIPFIAKIDTHSWSESSLTEDIGIDFDQIYAKHKAINNIEPLFDQLIEAIQKMIDTNSIDSLKVLHALEHLIATLRRSKTGSYLSMIAGWDFLRSLLQNWVFEQIKMIPILGPILAALQTTMTEMDCALEQMHTDMREEVQKNYNTKVPTLTYTRYGHTQESLSILADGSTV